MEQNKGLNAITNFRQTYDLMKSYLFKKRFSYVYEQSIKYYNKSQALFSNHEIMMLIDLVFYVLKKKMIAKTNPASKNFSIQAIQQIYEIMTNVYLSWEKVLMVQMTAQKPQFFNMLFRDKRYRQRKCMVKSQNLLFQPNKDLVITGNIDVEYKISIFLKQCLRMIINSLIVMVFSVDLSKIGRMVAMIRKAEQIMQKFHQHNFPVQKVHFYLIKCQIVELVEQKAQVCVNLKIEYQFPIGLFRLIYKNILKWQQTKLAHYIKLLLRVVISSAKNQLMCIKDAYILANQIKVLIYCTKKKDLQFERRSSTKDRRGVIGNDKSQVLSGSQMKKFTLNGKLTEKNQTYTQSKSKNKYLAYLKVILTQIQNYVETRKQLGHIIRVYMQGFYCIYKVNSSHENDEIIDEIPVLVEKQTKKNRGTKYTPAKVKQQYDSPFNKQSKKNSKNRYFNTSMKSSSYDEDRGNQAISGYNPQILKRKQNKIIIKNILNIKQKKKLSLAGNRNQTNNSKKQDLTKVLSTKSTQNSNDQNSQEFNRAKKFDFQRFFQTLAKKSFKEVSVFNVDLSQPINFLEQSQSDQDFQMQYQFQKKRRQQIKQINNRFYKKSNPNYNKRCEEGQDMSRRNLEGSKDRNEWLDENDQTQDLEDQQSRQFDRIDRRNKKVSEDIEFEEIKLLDQVIKDKIFNYLNLELDSMVSLKPQPQALSVAGQQKRDKKPLKQELIFQYSQVLSKTQNLKNQVDQLNRQRKLLSQKFNYKRSMIKTGQKYSPKQEQRQDVHSGVLRDLQNLYNTKNNLTQKALKCVGLYRKLLRMDDQAGDANSFTSTVQKYAKIYQRYGQNLATIGQAEQQCQNTFRNEQQIPIVQYIVQNRPVSLLEGTLKTKQIQNKFIRFNPDEQKSNDQKQIALRQAFDSLRGNICKSQFNQTNSLTKNFTSKVQSFQ